VELELENRLGCRIMISCELCTVARNREVRCEDDARSVKLGKHAKWESWTGNPSFYSHDLDPTSSAFKNTVWKKCFGCVNDMRGWIK
jgi:hypothetical protein